MLGVKVSRQLLLFFFFCVGGIFKASERQRGAPSGRLSALRGGAKYFEEGGEEGGRRWKEGGGEKKMLKSWEAVVVFEMGSAVESLGRLPL